MEALDKTIRTRLNEIVIMSELVADSLDLIYITPFHDEEVKKYILSIPIRERMRRDTLFETKYPLRMAYRSVLPQDCVVRPQTMAFSGSGVYECIKSIGATVSDNEFENACKDYFNFKSKLEYFLFKLYRKHYGFSNLSSGGCIHCGGDMGYNNINCKICGTLQINGKILEFNG